MNLETFCEHFELLADAPNAVPKLREMVLQLAVRGKLVEQCKDDEPARVFLSKMQQEKRESESQTIKESEKPFEIPTSWEWMRFSDVADFRAGKTPSRKDSRFWVDGVYPWVSIADMKHGETLLETKEQVPDVAASEVFRGTISPKGTLLMSFKLTIGKMSILGVDAFHNEAIISIYPHHEVLRDYFLKCLNGFDLSAGNKDAIKGKTLNRQSLSSIVLAVPPQNEILRILSKYDELMALCDDLEQKQQARAKGRSRLNTAVLTELSSAPDERSFKRAWERVGSAFDMLYSTPETISDLRKAVLQLAVQGKLVRQNPNDEPAEKLLERLDTAKGGLEQQAKAVTACSSHTLPTGWKMAQFNQVAKIASNLVNPTDYQNVPHIAPNHIEKSTGKLLVYKTVREDGVQSSKHKFFAGQLLYSKIRPNLSKAVVIGFDGLCSADMYPIDVLIDVQYIHLYILSDTFLQQVISADNRLAMPKVNQQQLSETIIAVPPLLEQKRIVAKVDELMALVDELETGLLQAQGDSERLLESLL